MLERDLIDRNVGHFWRKELQTIEGGLRGLERERKQYSGEE